MSSPYRPVPPTSVPTLTEVVPWPEVAAGASPGVDRPLGESASPAAASVSPAPASAAVAAPVAAPTSALSEAQLTQEVLAELQRRIDLMLEVRLREALAPILARAGDALIRDARKEFTGVLRDIVSGAVKQQLTRPDDR